MLSHFILQSSKLINVYAVDLDYRFIAVNKNNIRLMEEIFYFTPKIGDFPMNYLNSEDAARLKANVDQRKRVKHLYLWILLRQATKRFTGKICILPFITIAKSDWCFCFVLDVTGEETSMNLEIQRMAYEDVLTSRFIIDDILSLLLRNV